jgi:peroxiredoxin
MEMNMKYKILLLALVSLSLTVCAYGQSGEKAPDFSLTGMDGSSISLEEIKGNVIFINFWATWCPPCRQEIPGFIELYEKYKEDGMVILGVSLDRGGPNVVKEFMQEYSISYPMAMATQEFYEAYQPGQYIPTTFVVDRQGNIRDKHVGYMSKEMMEKIFLELSGDK